MEYIINFRDIPCDQKTHVINQVLSLGFVPAYGSEKTMMRIMNQSIEGNGPQYYFVFRDADLIGYLFLIGDEKRYRAFPWLSVGNEDEQRMELCEKMVRLQIQFFTDLERMDVVKRLESRLQEYRHGNGKRAEKDCR